MNIHKNARLTPRGRERIVRQVESGQTPDPAQVAPRRPCHLSSAATEDVHRNAVEQQRILADLTESAAKQSATIEEKDRSIAELSARITQLEGSSLSKAGDALGARERESLLKLVIGTAIKGYSHNPKACRSPTSKEIAGDLALIGLAMDEDTVRNIWPKPG